MVHVAQVENDEIRILAESCVSVSDVSETEVLKKLQDMDTATYDSPLELAKAKAEAHWMKTQLESTGTTEFRIETIEVSHFIYEVIWICGGSGVCRTLLCLDFPV